MKHTVRRVISADRKETLGYGVFRNYQVNHILEQAAINIGDCTDPEDRRPIHEQGKVFRLVGLHTTLAQAGASALHYSSRKLEQL